MIPKRFTSRLICLLVCILLVVVAIFLVRQALSPDKQSSQDTETAPLHPLAAHLAQSYTDDLPGLLKRKYIRVLTTINRTNFFLDQGHLVGFEYALLNKYQQFLNSRYKSKGLRIVLEYIPVERDELIPKLEQGYGDIAAAGLTITPKRAKRVDFTIPYLTDVREVIVTHKQGLTPQTLEDLAGQTIYVRQSSSYHESLIRLNQMLEEKDLAPVRIKAMDEHIETESILEMVNAGAIPVTVADEHIAQAWSKALPNIVVNDLAVRTGGQIAWMVRKNSPQLLASLNTFLQSHKQGTRLGNIYFERYYAPSKGLKNPRELANWDKLKKYKKVIQKYADKYGFDWLLILAMAFQESGLDNTKTSHAGAVGLLQIRPSTAADKNINIKNVRKLDNNVHAGVKYLHFLRTQYFDDPSIRPRDQIRFALAAYNAGPGNIRKARQEAKRMGLDPNRWFRNVELAVLKTIGRETVRYVSNINKYYILYTTIFNEEQAIIAAMDAQNRELSTKQQ
ncbi:lytic transglycosylase F [Desulfoplanes formicivorans]|nr:lytic transglycosylase F [Desulfoplanes formicivorans]